MHILKYAILKLYLFHRKNHIGKIPLNFFFQIDKD